MNLYRAFRFPLSDDDLNLICQLRNKFCVVGVFSTFLSGTSKVPGLRKRDLVGKLLGQVIQYDSEDVSVNESCSLVMHG